MAAGAAVVLAVIVKPVLAPSGRVIPCVVNMQLGHHLRGCQSALMRLHRIVSRWKRLAGHTVTHSMIHGGIRHVTVVVGDGAHARVLLASIRMVVLNPVSYTHLRAHETGRN